MAPCSTKCASQSGSRLLRDIHSVDVRQITTAKELFGRPHVDFASQADVLSLQSLAKRTTHHEGVRVWH